MNQFKELFEAEIEYEGTTGNSFIKNQLAYTNIICSTYFMHEQSQPLRLQIRINHQLNNFIVD